MKERTEKVLAWCTFASLFLPMLCYHNNGHDCMWDECMKIFYEGDLGCCVLRFTNDACMVLAVAWFFVIEGGAIIVSRSRAGSLSVFVFIAVLLAFSVFLAMLDPSKWLFAIASLVPAGMFTVCVWLDGRR